MCRDASVNPIPHSTIQTQTQYRPALSVRGARHGVEGCDEDGAARRRRASSAGGRAAVSGSASGWRPQSLAAGGKRSGAGCETLGGLPQLTL